MDEDEIRENIHNCVIPGNSDPAEVERLSCHGDGEKFKSLGDNDDSGITETPSRTSSISQSTTDRIDSDLESIASASQLTSSRRHSGSSPQKGNVRFQTDVEDSLTCSSETLNPENVKVPILGYETMEERSRFTVFRLCVQKSEHDVWHVFRRYTDFVQLNDRLRKCFPNIRLSLPPKRWFRDNFDKNFIEDRQLGLQAFIDNCVGHKEICNSKPVREFFCFDDPPGPHDSIEESRALCESLEDTMYNLRKELKEKNSEIDLLHDELALYKRQVEMLTTALRKNNESKSSSESPVSSTSLAECDLLTCTEVDQSQLQTKTTVEKVSENCTNYQSRSLDGFLPMTAAKFRLGGRFWTNIFEEEEDISKSESVALGEVTPAQIEESPTVKPSSSPEDKTTKKKKRSSIFKFRNRPSAVEMN
ncbi:sorting nexin-16-like isoform X2 [Ostrea edulis]|nr:sorting nexin-16-like isoform X2 [Ostrea edulis]XP_056008574.1 sorting nexin-16-like isoform X2 [Ostrea edulis]